MEEFESPAEEPEHEPESVEEETETFRIEFDQLKRMAESELDRNVDRYTDVPLKISIELGRINEPIKNILDWKEGSIVETQKLSGQPMEIMVNGRIFGRGEVVVGDNLAIRITELNKPLLD